MTGRATLWVSVLTLCLGGAFAFAQSGTDVERQAAARCEAVKKMILDIVTGGDVKTGIQEIQIDCRETVRMGATDALLEEARAFVERFDQVNPDKFVTYLAFEPVVRLHGHWAGSRAHWECLDYACNETRFIIEPAEDILPPHNYQNPYTDGKILFDQDKDFIASALKVGPVKLDDPNRPAPASHRSGPREIPR